MRRALVTIATLAAIGLGTSSADAGWTFSGGESWSLATAERTADCHITGDWGNGLWGGSLAAEWSYTWRACYRDEYQRDNDEGATLDLRLDIEARGPVDASLTLELRDQEPQTVPLAVTVGKHSTAYHVCALAEDRHNLDPTDAGGLYRLVLRGRVRDLTVVSDFGYGMRTYFPEACP